MIIGLFGGGDTSDFDFSILLFGRTVAQWALGAWVAWSVLRWFKKKDGKLFAHYLMHEYAYSAHYNGANPPQLEDRMADFLATISAAMDDNVDKVLVVGHSSGAHLAV